MKKTVLEKEEMAGKRKEKTGGKTNQKKAKTRKASENDDVCIYCTEGVTGRDEMWLQCAVCSKWAHELCSSGVGSKGLTYYDLCRAWR